MSQSGKLSAEGGGTAERDLAAAVAERFSTLPAKQQAVARLLAEEPSLVALVSAAEIAARAGVDTATVVRTCQSLGYSGWRELNAEAKRKVAIRPTFADRVAALSRPDGDLTTRIFAVARANVDETLHDLDRAAFEATATAIARAGVVLVAAGAVSAGPGQFLTSSLQIIGVRAVHVTGVGDAGPALAPLGPRDVVIGISLWRYLRATVQTLEYAANRVGATTVALTDDSLSPAALLADHTLLAHTETVGPRMGLAGVVALIEALVARVALIDPPRSQAGTTLASGLYLDGNVLGSQEEGPRRGQEWRRHLSEETDGD